MSSSAVCIDASFLLRLLLDHPLSEAVARLWRTFIEEDRPRVAPALLYYEIVNVIHRERAAGRLPEDLAELVLENALSAELTILQDPALHRSALALARRFALPAAYDAHYLAAAEATGAELWTADARLAGRVSASLPWVRVLV